MKYLLVKNWTEFQHYKDRNPPWIKLHRTILDDYGFCKLPDGAKGQLMLIWIFASQNEGKIPQDAIFLERKLGFTNACDLDLFIESGFLIEDQGDSKSPEKWPSRHIPKEVRDYVFQRDDHKCVDCSSPENLEIDHILPVSRGGESVAENLALRCRSCNRSKRTRTPEEHAEHIATQQSSNSLHSGGALARSQQKLHNNNTKAAETDSARETAFDRFWNEYPRKAAKEAARKAWVKIRPENGTVERIITAVQAQSKTDQWKRDDGQYVPHPATWLNQQRWNDEVAARPPMEIPE